MRFLKAFSLTSYLLISIGALSLVLTKGNLPFVLLVLVAVLVGWLGERAERPFLLAPSWGIPLGVLSFLWFVLDSFWLADTVVDALIHFLILVQAIKLLQFKADRDYFQLYTISFVQLVFTSVLASALFYALFFLLYVLVGSWVLILFHLKRESQRFSSPPMGSKAERILPEHGASSAVLDQVITPSFFWGTFSINLLVILFTVFFFLLVPRLGIGLIQKKFWQGQAMSGFSEEVQLGEIGLIKESADVVMRVELLGERLWPAMGLRWRGVALDYYTGRGWKLSHPQRRIYQPDPRGYFKFDPEELPFKGGRLLKQRFTLSEMDTHVLFGAYPAVGLMGKFFLISVDDTGSLYAPSAHYLGTRYTLYSLQFPQDRPPRRGADSRITPLIQRRYLQLPSLSPRIGRLARQLTQGVTDPWEQARRIEAYLKANYQYTLQMRDPGGREPVEHFLFHERRGHCEYFASAMVVLLRTLDLPARLVNGFLPGEWNDFGGYYLVRKRDAHSWVEMYSPGVGWLSFDPTPSGSSSVTSWLGGWAKYWDALQLKWYSYVIDYSFQDQRKLATGVGDRLSAARELLRGYQDFWPKLSRYFSFLIREVGRGKGVFPWVIPLAAASLCLLIYRMGHRIQWTGWGRFGSGAGTVKFYERLLRLLERKGFRRQGGHTPWEFCQAIFYEEGEVYQEVALITDRYYQVRYGGKRLSPEEVLEIEEGLDTLKKKMRKRNPTGLRKTKKAEEDDGK